MNVYVYWYMFENGLENYLNKNILSHGHFMYQEARPGSDHWPGEDILREGQVGEFHLLLIIIKFSKYLYIMLLPDFNRLNYSWNTMNYEIIGQPGINYMSNFG
jgi:hypothetical protein